MFYPPILNISRKKRQNHRSRWAKHQENLIDFIKKLFKKLTFYPGVQKGYESGGSLYLQNNLSAVDRHNHSLQVEAQ